MKVRVAAVSDAPIENAVIMNRERYRKSWNDPMVSLVHVVVDGSSGTAVVEDSIARQLGQRHRLQIRSRTALIDYFASQVRQAFGVLYLTGESVVLGA